MKKLFTLLSVFSVVLALSACEETPEEITENTPQTGDEEVMVDEVIYPHDEVISVNIDIQESDYFDMLVNATDEEYYSADITYNGYTLTDVAIRTKGNSSLRDVDQTGGDRYSFNVDLNLYEDQDLFGIDKIILNNLYEDPSMMAEYVTYEALEYLDTPSSRTTFVELSINGEYFGLYLSVEHIGNEFVDMHYGNDDGELYKPELGPGADLNFISSTTDYSALEDKLNEDSTNDTVIAFMEALETGVGIEELFNVDNYLKYLAVSTYTVNLDSYQSGAYHNYYLYTDNGVVEWIGWDYNMSFNGFPMISYTDEQAVAYLIDEPTVGSMDSYPLIEAILSNEEYLETYHTYLQQLLDGYFEIDTFTNRVDEIYEMIKDSVEEDPSKFYSYEEFEDAVFTSSTIEYSILQFVEERNASIQNQLDGTIPSTNNGDGNEGGDSRPPRR